MPEKQYEEVKTYISLTLPHFIKFVGRQLIHQHGRKQTEVRSLDLHKAVSLLHFYVNDKTYVLLARAHTVHQHIVISM